MSVTMANYMSAFLKKKTAVCEWNDSRDFLRIKDICCGLEDMYGEQRCFTYKKADYYPKGVVGLMSLNNSDYDVVVVDFGSKVSSLEEFAGCRHRIVMSSLEPWHFDRYEAFCDKLQEYGGSDTWLHILHGDNGSIRAVGRKCEIYSIKRPVVENPFIINAPLIEFFQTLF